IAAGILRDATAKWYDENQEDGMHKEILIALWMSELEMIKQNPGQSVSDYTQKFKMLMQRVDTTGGFRQHYIVSKFVRGLSPHLMIIVVGHSPQTLDTAITKVKEIKTGFTIAQPIQQQQII
ncbi:13706_t:CDS:2, partial [Funneliformis geosporum]